MLLEPIMDELSVLKYIFKDDLKLYCEDGRVIYKICIDEKYLEFECNEDYPNTVPELLSNIDRETIDKVKEESKQFISTPMIFDMVRLAVIKLEEVSIGKDKTGKISISYSINDDEKITEEDFLSWKAKNTKNREILSGTTGREIFLERKRNRKEIQDDEDT